MRLLTSKAYRHDGAVTVLTPWHFGLRVGPTWLEVESECCREELMPGGDEPLCRACTMPVVLTSVPSRRVGEQDEHAVVAFLIEDGGDVAPLEAVVLASEVCGELAWVRAQAGF